MAKPTPPRGADWVMPSPATGKQLNTQSAKIMVAPKPIRLNAERSMTPTKPSLPPITVAPIVEPEAVNGDDWNAKTKAGESWGEHHNLVDVASNSLDRLSEQHRVVPNRNQALDVQTSTPQAFSQNDFSTQQRRSTKRRHR